MKNPTENHPVLPNRSVEIAGLYHKQMLGLINIALTHNKQAIEAAHRRGAELLKVKSAKEVNELVAQHMISQLNESLGFAVDAYQLGFEANLQLSRLFAQQMEESLAMTHDAINAQGMPGNPISNMALSLVRNALDKSHAALNGVKAA